MNKLFSCDFVSYLQRFGTDANAPRDTRVLRDEIRDLEQQNEALQREIKDIQRDLGDEKRATERVTTGNAIFQSHSFVH